MSATTTDFGTETTALVMCEQCGTTREASRRYMGHRGQRWLRCSTCDATVWHSSVGMEDDFREEDNRRQDDNLATYQQNLGALDELGIEVKCMKFHGRCTDGTRYDVKVLRYVCCDGGFGIQIDENLTPRERVRALEWAMDFVLPSRARRNWEGSPVYQHGEHQALMIVRSTGRG